MKNILILRYRIILMLFSVMLTTTCSQREFDREVEGVYNDNFDKDLNLNRGEIRNLLRPGKDKVKDSNGEHQSSIEAPELQSLLGMDAPPFSPIVIAPDEPEIKSKKLVTLTITENVSLKDVFLELARLADLELALDPGIKGGIILSVNDRPINDVLEMIAEMAKLRYTVDHGVLKVVKDTPYLINYNVDFMNLIRSSKGSINTQTQVLSSAAQNSSGSGAGGGSALSSGSSNAISTEYDGDLWASVEKNLVSIIGSNLASIDSKFNGDFKSDGPASSRGLKPGEAEASDGTLLRSSDAASRVKSIEDPSQSPTPNIYYNINKQAGIVSVMATSKKQKSVKEYLDAVKISMSSQVLIEAKVVEVTLDEQFSAGIDWTGIGIGSKFRMEGKFGNPNQDALGVLGSGLAFAGRASGTLLKQFPNATPANPMGSKLGSVLQMIQGFGVTRTLSNPRITVLNNQQAVLTFAKNQAYYSVKGTLQQNNSSAQGLSGSSGSAINNNNMPISVESTLHTVPIGVILSLQPSINLDTQEVTMHVRPTLSTKLSGIQDPAVQLLMNSIQSGTGASEAAIIASQKALASNETPVIQVRELDTILKVKSGEVMIIGGLIQHNNANLEQGIPFLSRLPFIGGLARTNEIYDKATETVILIQATIVPTDGYYHPQDKNVYEKFTNDPRPLLF